MKQLRWFGSILVLLATASMTTQACPVVTRSYGYASYPTYSNYYQSYTPYYPTYTPVYAAVFTPLLTVAVPAVAVGASPPTTPTLSATGVSASVSGTAGVTPSSTPVAAASSQTATATATGSTPCEQRVARLEAEVAEMRAFMAGKASVASATAPQQQETGPAATATTALSIFQGKCAACHGGAAATEKDLGGAFRLLKPDGSPVDLDGRMLGKLAGKVYTGKMPPPENKKGIAPLTDQEVGVIMQWVNTNAK